MLNVNKNEQWGSYGMEKNEIFIKIVWKYY